MDPRTAIQRLSQRYRLDARSIRRLQQLAELDQEPPQLLPTLWRGLTLFAATLGGGGAIMWVAANWDSFGRWGQFTLLQAWVALACLGAWMRPAVRTPLAVLAFLGIGALWAYFGQTYQTGADAWGLFALWAMLGVPLCLATRSDALWLPWAMVVVTGISLWSYSHTGHRWEIKSADWPVYLIAWGMAIGLCALLSQAAQRWTGAGLWSFRLAVTLTVVMVTSIGIDGLFAQTIAFSAYAALAVTIVAALVLLLRECFEIYAVSAVALGLNVQLIGICTHWLSRDAHGDFVGELFVLVVLAATLLALSVGAILRLARRYAKEEAR